MHVWTATAPPGIPPTAVTIGTFDGVHRGHRMLIDRVVADGPDLLPVVLTFDPHPMAVIRPELAPPLLTTMPRRLELFAEAGVGATLVLPFTAELAAESAERFATRVLAEELGAQHVVVGRNFRFGHRAAGDVVLLTELGRELGFTVTVVDLAPLPGAGSESGGAPAEPGSTAVSSTAVRAMIAEGDVAGAARALGRPHRITGTVVHGDHRGRELGYPTANLDPIPGLAIPADGVYAARLRASGDPAGWRPAAVSVGTNPTFDGESRRVEAYVLDAPAGFDVYGAEVDLDLVAHLRPMLRFEGVEALLGAMSDDVARTREVLAR